MARFAKKSPAVFIDRDGTIIHEKNYLRRIKDVRLFSGAPKALTLLRKAGYRLIVITNQSGIARGYLTEKKLHTIHRHLNGILNAREAPVDAFYFCPHADEDRCNCRKPKLGLIKRAQKDFNIDLKRSYVIGDHTRDFILGQNMGGKGIFILTGHGREEQQKIRKSNGRLIPDKTTKDLLGAARWIMRQKEQ